MADPISLLTSIAGAIGACAKISKALIDLGMQFAATKAAASSLAAECFTMRAVLERLSSLMKSRPELLAPRGRGKADLGPCFQGIVQSIDQGICDLDRQISSLSRTGKPGDMNTGHRILFMFKEGSIKSTVDDIRQQRATLSMLLSCIQSETLDDIQVQLGGVSPRLRPAQNPSSVTNPAQLDLGGRLRLSDGTSSVSPRPRIRIHMKRLLDNPEFATIVSSCPKPGKARRTDQKYVHRLHSAIANGDVQTTKNLLRIDKVDPNTPLANSALTPLHRAIDLAERTGAAEAQRGTAGGMILWLAFAGADLAAVNAEGCSPLARITLVPTLWQVLAIMCELGADTGSRDGRQKTPLHWVSVREPIHGEGATLVRYLVAYGADVNATDNNGSTPLICAVKEGRKSRVVQLLDYGADLAIADADGWSALSWAVKKGDASLVQMLCQHGAPLDATLTIGMLSGISCLRYAAGSQKRDIVGILLDAGADVDVEDNGSVPLLTALHFKDVETAKLLLKHKPNVKAKAGETGRLPIHLGTFDATLVKMLLQAGSPIDPLDKGNRTPLTVAVVDGNEETAKVLLDGGADVDHETSPFHTILKEAVLEDNRSMSRLLLSYGAQVGTRMGIERFGYMHTAAFKGHVDMLALLLENGAIVEDETVLGHTPIFYAAAGGHRLAVDFLLSRGANLRKRDVFGGDILEWSVKHPAMLRFILQEGFDPNRTDDDGGTPLHASAYDGHLASTRILLQHGARQFYTQAFYQGPDATVARDKTNALKGTPAEIARLKGHVEVAELIEKWKYT